MKALGLMYYGFTYWAWGCIGDKIKFEIISMFYRYNTDFYDDIWYKANMILIKDVLSILQIKGVSADNFKGMLDYELKNKGKGDVLYYKVSENPLISLMGNDICFYLDGGELRIKRAIKLFHKFVGDEVMRL